MQANLSSPSSPKTPPSSTNPKPCSAKPFTSPPRHPNFSLSSANSSQRTPSPPDPNPQKLRSKKKTRRQLSPGPAQSNQNHYLRAIKTSLLALVRSDASCVR